MSEHTETVRTFDSPFTAPPPPTVWPAVGFSDVDAGVRLITEGLGFVVTMTVHDDAGRVTHAEARWPDGGGVMFGSRDARDDGRSAWVYVVAAEAATVDAAHERVRALPGVTVTTPLGDTDYGSHQFGVRDADGNEWTVGTYRGAT
jgi:uncharacterized glyoxalase superfamily protein PhnB